MQCLPWVLENGLNTRLLVDQIASARLRAFAWLDVTVAALALHVFIISDERRNKVPRFWLPILGTPTVGVSLGLPVYLL